MPLQLIRSMVPTPETLAAQVQLDYAKMFAQMWGQAAAVQPKSHAAPRRSQSGERRPAHVQGCYADSCVLLVHRCR